MADFPPPPTYILPIRVDAATGEVVFDETWLNWFIQLTKNTGSSGAGSVSSVAQSFTGGLISVSGSPITTSGTLALTVAGTSGGIPYFSGATTWASSGALADQAIVLGGGAGASPTGLTLGSAHQVPEVNTGATALQYTSWPTMRRTVAIGETLTVDSDYSAVFVGRLTNNGTVTNNGAIAVI